MRIAWFIVLLALAGCSTPASQPTPELGTAPIPLSACSEPRPQLCTMQYAPACAELVAGGQREYASPCNACADVAVAGYREGPCPK